MVAGSSKARKPSGPGRKQSTLNFDKVESGKQHTAKGGVNKKHADDTIDNRKGRNILDLGGSLQGVKGKKKAITGRKASTAVEQHDAYDPKTSEIERKRLALEDELEKVEQQIYDLETKYLDQSSAFGNAIRGYEGFLGGVGQGNRKVVVRDQDRLFSMSSSLIEPQG